MKHFKLICEKSVSDPKENFGASFEDAYERETKLDPCYKFDGRMHTSENQV